MLQGESKVAKVVLIGYKSVGKTSIVHYYVNKTSALSTHATLGVSFMEVPVNVEETRFLLRFVKKKLTVLI